jgi:hypothetical protein
MMDVNSQKQNSAQDLNNQAGVLSSTNLVEKTASNEANTQNNSSEETKAKTKKVVPLTDDYIKSLENSGTISNNIINNINAKLTNKKTISNNTIGDIATDLVNNHTI